MLSSAQIKHSSNLTMKGIMGVYRYYVPQVWHVYHHVSSQRPIVVNLVSLVSGNGLALGRSIFDQENAFEKIVFIIFCFNILNVLSRPPLLQILRLSNNWCVVMVIALFDCILSSRCTAIALKHIFRLYWDMFYSLTKSFSSGMLTM